MKNILFCFLVLVTILTSSGVSFASTNIASSKDFKIYQMKVKFLGCYEKNDVEKMMKFLSQKDELGLNVMIMENFCKWIPKGAILYSYPNTCDKSNSQDIFPFLPKNMLLEVYLPCGVIEQLK